MSRSIDIRGLNLLDELAAAVDLQKVFWGDDLESVVPAHMLFSLAEHGGHVLAAFDGSQMVGVLIGFLGTGLGERYCPTPSNIQIVSKRMVVLPNYRSRGIGFQLKLAQRELALQQQIPLVTWTYDPLQTLNAHLNIHKLGGVSGRYLENHYGVTPGGNLTLLGSSDRLLVEWHVQTSRVMKRLAKRPAAPTAGQLLAAHVPIVNPMGTAGDGSPIPPQHWDAYPTEPVVLVEVPSQYLRLAQAQPDRAVAWRLHTRAVFQRCFALGYWVTDFVRPGSENTGRAFYVLSRIIE